MGLVRVESWFVATVLACCKIMFVHLVGNRRRNILHYFFFNLSEVQNTPNNFTQRKRCHFGTVPKVSARKPIILGFNTFLPYPYSTSERYSTILGGTFVENVKSKKSAPLNALYITILSR
jgi:hypothetical protein